MHYLTISPETADTHQQILLNALFDQKNRRKVYRTYCDSDDRSFIVMTASKEAHLGIGLLSHMALEAFCWIIENEFEKYENPVMLVAIAKEENDDHAAHREQFLVTRSVEGSGAVILHLSPARG